MTPLIVVICRTLASMEKGLLGLTTKRMSIISKKDWIDIVLALLG
jgi:hypothetical protein